MSTFQELGDHTDDDDAFSDIQDMSELKLGFRLNKSSGFNALQSSNVSLNSAANYFSFQQHTKEHSSNNRNNASLLSEHPNRSHSSSPMHQLPQTDFISSKGRLKYSANSWFEQFRIKYFLVLSSFLSFVAIIAFFVIPRAIECWIEITVQKLSFDSNPSSIQMVIMGHLYVSNPNYLPITLESMQMDIYFNHTLQSKPSSMSYLLSFTNSWNEMQNEQIFDVDYPFSVTLSRNISNNTLSDFEQFVATSCKSTGSYVLRAHIYPKYTYTQTLHQIAFYTDTNANQGCQTNTTHPMTLQAVT